MTRPTGLVLAGGASTRMGVDKANLRRDGRRLLERAVDCLSAVCDEVLVASGDGQRLPGPWRQVADAVPDAGPLGGLVAGLEAARTPLLAVLAVDLPSPSGQLLAWLGSSWDGRSWAVVPHAEGRIQPLHAVYATDAAARLRAALDAGDRSLTAMLARSAAVQVIPAAVWAAVAAPDFATNVNTPGEAERAGLGTGSVGLGERAADTVDRGGDRG